MLRDACSFPTSHVFYFITLYAAPVLLKGHASHQVTSITLAFIPLYFSEIQTILLSQHEKKGFSFSLQKGGKKKRQREDVKPKADLSDRSR